MVSIGSEVAIGYDELSYERRGSRDIPHWFALLIGGVMLASVPMLVKTGLSSSGARTSLIIGVGFLFLGGLAFIRGAMTVFGDRSRGCRVDAASSELHWWSYRKPDGTGGYQNSIKIADIGYLTYSHHPDGDRFLELYDNDGKKLSHFGDMNIPGWRPMKWVKLFTETFPHIEFKR